MSLQVVRVFHYWHHKPERDQQMFSTEKNRSQKNGFSLPQTSSLAVWEIQIDGNIRTKQFCDQQHDVLHLFVCTSQLSAMTFIIIVKRSIIQHLRGSFIQPSSILRVTKDAPKSTDLEPSLFRQRQASMLDLRTVQLITWGRSLTIELRWTSSPC